MGKRIKDNAIQSARNQILANQTSLIGSALRVRREQLERKMNEDLKAYERTLRTHATAFFSTLLGQ